MEGLEDHLGQYRMLADQRRGGEEEQRRGGAAGKDSLSGHRFSADKGGEDTHHRAIPRPSAYAAHPPPSFPCRGQPSISSGYWAMLHRLIGGLGDVNELAGGIDDLQKKADHR
jgi:hypothetical protein